MYSTKPCNSKRAAVNDGDDGHDNDDEDAMNKNPSDGKFFKEMRLLHAEQWLQTFYSAEIRGSVDVSGVRIPKHNVHYQPNYCTVSCPAPASLRIHSNLDAMAGE